MSDQLPVRTTPTEIIPRGSTPPARRTSGEIQKDEASRATSLPVRVEPKDAGVPAQVPVEQNAFNGTANTVQGIQGHVVQVLINQEVNHYHAPAAARDGGAWIETTGGYSRVIVPERRVEPCYERPARDAHPTPTHRPPAVEPSSHPLSFLLAVFLGFIVLVFVVVAGFRAVSTPTTVIVDEEREPSGSFMDYLDAESRKR